VIARVERTGALQCPQVGDVRHHDDHRRVAALVGADRAGILRIDIAADAADHDLFQRGLHGGGERAHHLLAFLDQKQRRASRGPRAEARQARQQLHEALDLGTRDGLRHG
jgi:hypothetical protein